MTPKFKPETASPEETFEFRLQKINDVEKDGPLYLAAGEEERIFKGLRNVSALAPLAIVTAYSYIGSADRLSRTPADKLHRDIAAVAISAFLSGAFETLRRVSRKSAKIKAQKTDELCKTSPSIPSPSWTKRELAV